MEQKIPERSLRRRVVDASLWIISGHFASQALRLGSNLIMTRLLVPEMFGIMAVANVLMVGLTMFSDLGLKQHIIHSSRADDPKFLNTVWTVQIIRGLVIWVLALLMAGILTIANSFQLTDAGSVYAEPVLPVLICVLSFNAVIIGFESTKLATANRSLNLGAITKILLLSQIAGLVVMISWALISQTIWALVGGALASACIRVLLTHVLLPGVSNRIFWDKENFLEVFNFGKWVFLSSIWTFLAINGDRLLLGGFVDSSTLGYYAIATLILGSLVSAITKINSGVVFPALSEVVRDEVGKLKSVYYKLRKPADILTLFVGGFLFMTGQTLISILYDDRYQDAGWMLEILSVTFLVERYKLVSECLLALGNPRIMSYLNAAYFVTLFIMLPVSYHLGGINGAVWGIVGSRIVVIPLIFYIKARHDLLDFYAEFKVMVFLILGVLAGLAFNQLPFLDWF